MRFWHSVKNGRIRKIIYAALAALLLALLWIVSCPGRRAGADKREYSVVILGDSIIGQCRDETSVTEQLSEMLGEPVLNGAFGGTRMTMRRDVEDNYAMELLDMVSLSRAIAADDFGAQQTIRSRRPATEYFGDSVDELECVDFQRVKVLILEFGVNDYHMAVQRENAEIPKDVTTFAGAIRDVVGVLREKYPQMRILLATPTYAWYLDQGVTCETFDTGGGVLERYVETEQRVAEELDVEIVDLYHDFYSHDQWEDWQRYTEDGLHPNAEGRRMIAVRLAEQLIGSQ